MQRLFNDFYKRLKRLIVASGYNPVIIFHRILWSFHIRVLLPVIYTILAVPLILVLFILKPIVKVKLCGVNFPRIGHLGPNTDLFLRRLRAGLYDPTYIYIGCNVYAKPPANRQLLKMYKRHMPIIENRFFGGIVFSRIFRSTQFYQEMPLESNEYYEFNELPNVLSFTEKEEELGRRELRKMGIGDKDWFVCFHARSKMYENEVLRRSSDDPAYDVRNCNIKSFLPAMEYISKEGGYAIRLGYKVEKLTDKKENPKIIDYATKFRTDFMDIYLSAKCRFFVGCASGPFYTAEIFNVPVAGTNFSHLEINLFRKGDIFIPKKIRKTIDGSLMTFREIFASAVSRYQVLDKFKELGLEVIENSPLEILGLVKEMNEYLQGKFEYSAEEEELQKEFYSLVCPDHLCYGSPVRIGALFLEENKNLLLKKSKLTNLEELNVSACK